MKEIKEKLNKDGTFPINDEILELDPMVSSAEQTAIIADTYIKTQAGKEWYYAQIALIDYQTVPIQVKMYVSELANYKFPIGDTDD